MVARSIIALALIATIQIATSVSFAEEGDNYKKQSISDSKFGVDQLQEFNDIASHVAEKMNDRIYGQEAAAKVLQEKLIQYGESWPNRKGSPVSLNFIGLSGIGKTGMLEHLKELGMPIVFFNAQDYVNPENQFLTELQTKIAEHDGSPLIVVIDELDKLPEIIDDGASRKERTNSVVGTLNDVLSEGTIHSPLGRTIDVSNIMFVTTMNFSPREMERFSHEVLKEQKSFYDFSLEDFEAFDQWMREKPASMYKVLSNLFRTNTVGRLAPNTIMLRPLSMDAQKRIVELSVQQSIKEATTGDATSRRIEVTYDPAILEYIGEKSIYLPAGARQTIVRTKSLIEQAIRFGSRLAATGEDSMIDRPRHVHLKMADGKMVVEVTPLLWTKGDLMPAKTFSAALEYDAASQLFDEPRNVISAKPAYRAQPGSWQPRPPTKKVIQTARFPKGARISKSVEIEINHELLGQEETVKIVLEDMSRYLGRVGPAVNEPSVRTISGFPGIGKSELVKLVGKKLNLPIIRINMQQFSTDNPDTVSQFLATLEREIEKAREDGAYGDNEEDDTGNPKYIILLEELDKIFEVSPDDGRFVNRPIMAAIKDLLQDGRVSVTTTEGGEHTHKVDIRDAFTFITMNFAVDRFDFEADPRRTTMADVKEAWQQLKANPASVKSLLGSMFLPETVSRLLPRFTIMRPLEKDSYVTLVQRQVKKVVDGRLLDSQGKNVSQIEIRLTPDYRKYLFNETVIPSEGARHTVITAQEKISADVEAALTSIPKNGKYATAPLILTLDFKYAQKATIIRASLKSEPGKPAGQSEVILKRPVALSFPPTETAGKVMPDRVFTAAHEFGHAYVALRFGIRLDQIVVVSPKPGIGGYVKYVQAPQSAQEVVGDLYSTLASRALERIFSSPTPQDRSSVLSITTGPSSDIQKATLTLYMALYELGLDPDGGTLDRNFSEGSRKYASYAAMPPELADKLGQILRDLEDFMLKDLLHAHTQKWYVEKIGTLAQAGAMNEKQFYSLVGYYYPGPIADQKDQRVPPYFRDVFKNYMVSEPKRITRSHKVKLAQQPLSIDDSIDLYMTEFARLVKLHLHSDDTGPAPSKKGDCDSLLTDK